MAIGEAVGEVVEIDLPKEYDLDTRSAEEIATAIDCGKANAELMRAKAAFYNAKANFWTLKRMLKKNS